MIFEAYGSTRRWYIWIWDDVRRRGGGKTRWDVIRAIFSGRDGSFIFIAFMASLLLSCLIPLESTRADPQLLLCLLSRLWIARIVSPDKTPFLPGYASLAPVAVSMDSLCPCVRTYIICSRLTDGICRGKSDRSQRNGAHKRVEEMLYSVVASMINQLSSSGPRNLFPTIGNTQQN